MYERELEIATRLAQRAGAVALEAMQSRVEVQEKGPGDLVTSVDKALNELIVTALREAFPDDAIVAEESEDNSARAERIWFVDPIDGTKDFVNRTGEWSVMIGLAVGGRPAVGVVFQPTTDQLYGGTFPGEAHCTVAGKKRQIHCSTRKAAESLVMVCSANHPDRFAGQLALHAGVTQSYRHGSLGCKLVQIAEGRADIYGNGSGKVSLWDTCAGEAILLAAGGGLLTAAGSELRYDSLGTGILTPFVAFHSEVRPSWVEGLNELL